MNGRKIVTFSAWNDGGYIGLAQILMQLGDLGSNLLWFCDIEELAPEPHDPGLDDITPGDGISTLELLRLVAPDKQVIDGRFTGFPPGEAEAALVITAVDSSEWEIETGSLILIQRWTAAYPDVTVSCG
ncbi:hypothetical protein [Streptomyces sp. NPDC005989]|uniref:hypothetical protein n=1 Tax=Streptomyces sp. NPDC005989 TaxID=3156727 RepID=UPI003402FFF5